MLLNSTHLVSVSSLNCIFIDVLCAFLVMPLAVFLPFFVTRHNLSQFKAVYIHPFNSRLSRTTQVSWYKKGKTNVNFTEARDSEWQWHQLGHIHLHDIHSVCTSLQTDNHASTPPLSFLQAECPSCRPTNSVEALKALKKAFKAVYYYSC